MHPVAAGPSSLSIGVAARNEEATVAQALRSIEVALAHLVVPVPAEVIVALNGCTDRTPEVVAEFVAAYRGDTAFRVVQSPAGLVEAQRAIAAVAKSPDYLILVDADCLLDPLCLHELVRAMTEHPQAQAAWASMVPADGGRRRSFWRTVFNFADYHPDVVQRGRHLCGRAFAIRNYDVPRCSAEHPPAQLNRRLAAFLSLDLGPVSDDSFLSRSLIARFGPASIRHAPDARVYFQPIPRLGGFYNAQRRKGYEPRRLDLLFPQYRSMRRRHFGRRVDRAAYARLRPAQRLQCRLYQWLYLALRHLAELQLAARLAAVRMGVPLRPCDLWPVVAGTKEPFTAAATARPAAAPQRPSPAGEPATATAAPAPAAGPPA